MFCVCEKFTIALFSKQTTEGPPLEVIQFVIKNVWQRRGEVRIDRIEAHQTQRWTYQDDGGLSHGQRSPFYLKWDPKPPKHNQLRAASRLEIIAQCKCNILLHFYPQKDSPGMLAQKLSTSRAHTRRQQGTHCMHLPPWPDGLLWAGLRYLRWTWQWSRVGRRGTFHVRAKQGIVSRASGPTPGIWRTQVHCTYSGFQTYPSHPYEIGVMFVRWSTADAALPLPNNLTLPVWLRLWPVPQ